MRGRLDIWHVEDFVEGPGKDTHVGVSYNTHIPMAAAATASSSRERCVWRSPRRSRPASSVVERVAAAKAGGPPAAATVDDAPAAAKVDGRHERFPWDVDLLLRRCRPEPLPMGGCVVHGLLDEGEQRWLYEELARASDSSCNDIQQLRMDATHQGHMQANPKNIPLPFVVWTHPYARRCTAKERPSALLRWSQRLMHALAPGSRSLKIDSMVAQLYNPGSGMQPHKDANLSWGVIVALGSPSTLSCWDEKGAETTVRFRSGDVVVGEFGIMPHAVQVGSEPPPSWWRSVDHYGTKTRCSILFRQALSEKQQRRMCDKRAMKLHNCTVAQLSKQTGKEEAFLISLLAQLDLKV